VRNADAYTNSNWDPEGDAEAYSDAEAYADAYGNSNCTSESNSHGYGKSNWDPDCAAEAYTDAEAASHAGAAPDPVEATAISPYTASQPLECGAQLVPS